jgi:hypothetical protein
MSPRNTEGDEIGRRDDAATRDQDRTRAEEPQPADPQVESEKGNDRDHDGLPDKPAAYRVPS